jgi:hypothetical protein
MEVRKILNFTDEERINWTRIAAVVSTLILMVYAPKLWLTTKNFPVIPMFDWVPIPTGILEYTFWGILFVSQLIYIFYNKRWLGWLALLTYVYLAMVDQNRLQPYFYQSALTLLAIVLFPKKADSRKVLYTVILIFFATYFWSGIQKLNDAFYIKWLSALDKHFNCVASGDAALICLPPKFLELFTYAVPWLEASMGILLLFNRTRTFAIGFILGMHAIIVFLLFYLGYGYNVVPWNFQNMVSVVALFYGLKTLSPLDFFVAKFDWQRAVLVFMVMVLPLANNLKGYYDNLLSFHFFTADLKYYNVTIHEDLEDKLPENAQAFYRYHEGRTYINMNEWAQADNKVLFYPEERIIKYMETYLRSFANNPEQENLILLHDYNKIEYDTK